MIGQFSPELGTIMNGRLGGGGAEQRISQRDPADTNPILPVCVVPTHAHTLTHTPNRAPRDPHPGGSTTSTLRIPSKARSRGVRGVVERSLRVLRHALSAFDRKKELY